MGTSGKSVRRQKYFSVFRRTSLPGKDFPLGHMLTYFHLKSTVVRVTSSLSVGVQKGKESAALAKREEERERERKRERERE